MISAASVSTVFASSLIALQSERNRLANILHSRVAPLLTAAGLQLEALCLDCASLSPEFPAKAGEIQRRLDDAMRVVRELSAELDPNLGERLGLRTALKLLVDRVQPSFRGAVVLEFAPDISAPEPLAGALYSIAEQAVENAVVHSGATCLEVRVERCGSGLVLEIRDDGRGFEAECWRTHPTGLGLPLIFQYAEQWNASVRIQSGSATGTIVRVTVDGVEGVPLPPAADNFRRVVNAHAE